MNASSKNEMPDLPKALVRKASKGPTLAAVGAYKNEQDAKVHTGVGTQAPKAIPTRKPAPAKAKAPKVKASKPAPKGNFVTLADIARSMKVEPKVARAKARRSDAIIKLSVGDQWQFRPADKAKVIALLKKDERKA